jgi:hypothetical protein
MYEQQQMKRFANIWSVALNIDQYVIWSVALNVDQYVIWSVALNVDQYVIWSVALNVISTYNNWLLKTSTNVFKDFGAI